MCIAVFEINLRYVSVHRFMHSAVLGTFGIVRRAGRSEAGAERQPLLARAQQAATAIVFGGKLKTFNLFGFVAFRQNNSYAVRRRRCGSDCRSPPGSSDSSAEPNGRAAGAARLLIRPDKN